MYTVWRYQNNRIFTNPSMVRKKLIQFYFTFYIFMFFSLFYVLRFYFVKKWIFAAITVIWIPQILSNFYYNRRLSLPLMNIFLITLNRLIPPVFKVNLVLFQRLSGKLIKNFIRLFIYYYVFNISILSADFIIFSNTNRS
jgi:hypothetical protein